MNYFQLLVVVVHSREKLFGNVGYGYKRNFAQSWMDGQYDEPLGLDAINSNFSESFVNKNQIVFFFYIFTISIFIVFKIGDVASFSA